MGMSVYLFNLPFALARCDSCGVERAAGEPCPRCGSVRIYDEPHVDRRRRIVDQARPHLEHVAPVAGPIAPRDVFDALGTWLTDFLTAVQWTAEGTEAEASNAPGAAFASFRLIADRVGASPRDAQNPVWTTIDEILAALRSVIDSYLAALTTRSSPRPSRGVCPCGSPRSRGSGTASS